MYIDRNGNTSVNSQEIFPSQLSKNDYNKKFDVVDQHKNNSTFNEYISNVKGHYRVGEYLGVNYKLIAIAELIYVHLGK
jgi:hypothetical protein